MLDTEEYLKYLIYIKKLAATKKCYAFQKQVTVLPLLYNPWIPWMQSIKKSNFSRKSNRKEN